MKTIITLAFVLISFQISYAQQTKIFQHTSGSRKTQISLSGGMISTQNDLLKNGFNIQADIFLPFYGRGNFALGANLATNYAGIKSSIPDNNVTANQYQVYTASHTVSTNKNGSSSGSFSGLLGIQSMIGMGRFYISPLVNAGYSNFKLQGFTQTGSYSVNGQSQDKELVKREKESSGGLVIKPQLKLGYYLTPTVSLFASSAYIIGPNIKSTTQTWIPQGGFKADNTYEPQQILNGSWSATSGSDKYKAIEINVGVALALGKRMHKPETIRRSGAVSGSYAREAQPKVKCNCGTEIYGKDEEACKRICKFLKDGTYSNARANFSSQELEQIKDDFLNSLFINKDGIMQLKPGLFKEVLSPNDWNDKKVSVSKEGKSYVYLGNQDDLVAIISIPSGNPAARVKECADCTTSTCTHADGSTTTYDCTCVNGFCMCVLCPDITRLSSDPKILAPDDGGVSNNEPGIKHGNVPAFASPGQPIGGIVVKGGKNPGGNTLNLITNENGEVKFTVVEKGEYILRITAPEANNKSISEKGLKRSSNPAMQARPGQPIGGIVVKGGKNPGGNMLNLITNENGEVKFTVAEKGEYILRITAPEANNKSISEKGLK
ncbi:hypothetical protein ACR782_09575 [Sphingobacterium spiritivorum]|uniref:hypothetical protein n=1 Tax=Sphingobacterium spiritivorum TaxID=258 RepID=UPI003DA4120D